MKKVWLLIIAAAVVAGLTLQYRWNSQELQTQLLNPTVTQPETANSVRECLKLAEKAANTCLKNLAGEQSNANICEQITVAAERATCKRLVELER